MGYQNRVLTYEAVKPYHRYTPNNEYSPTTPLWSNTYTMAPQSLMIPYIIQPSTPTPNITLAKEMITSNETMNTNDTFNDIHYVVYNIIQEWTCIPQANLHPFSETWSKLKYQGLTATTDWIIVRHILNISTHTQYTLCTGMPRGWNKDQSTHQPQYFLPLGGRNHHWHSRNSAPKSAMPAPSIPNNEDFEQTQCTMVKHIENIETALLQCQDTTTVHLEKGSANNHKSSQ